MDGREYHFISHDEFTRREAAGELLEWAHVHGNRYGTPRGPVEAALSAGHDMLFDIDWQGAQQIREKLAGDVVSVFILPPTGKALEKRLVTRAQMRPRWWRGAWRLRQARSRTGRVRLRHRQRPDRRKLRGLVCHRHGGAT